MWRKTIVATALLGAGLASTTGAAFAGDDPGDHGGDKSSSSSHDDHGDQGGHGGHEGHGKHGHGDERGKSCQNDVAAKDGGDTYQDGLLNVSDLQTILPVNACNNNIPLNILGVQVPIQDGSLNLPVLSPADHHSGSSSEA